MACVDLLHFKCLEIKPPHPQNSVVRFVQKLLWTEAERGVLRWVCVPVVAKQSDSESNGMIFHFHFLGELNYYKV